MDPTAFPFTSVTVTDIITLHADLTETLTKKPWMAMVGFWLPKMPTGYTLTRRLRWGTCLSRH